MTIKIQRPDETEIRVEHHNLYKGLNQKSVAAASGVSSTTLSRRLNHEEAIVTNPVYEVIMEMIGSVESGQQSIGKGIFGMIYRYASELGLVGVEPIDILKLARQKLKSIDKPAIENLSNEELVTLLVEVTDLEEEAGTIKSDIMSARRQRIVHGRPIELNGDRLGGRSQAKASKWHTLGKGFARRGQGVSE